MGKNKWTRNQKILLVGIILTFIGLVINTLFLIQTSDQQIIINQNLNELNAKVGSFEVLSANNASIPYLNIGNATLFYNGSCLVSIVDTSTLNIC
ncbi:MAG: hypothetical protein KAJ91_00645 [Candidatus Aenigmarchaeota archaeon]|nr:hypothetical protein [Candidatus Aenigmarchaeota archaeon]